jgi:hypothetical protein
LNSALISVKRFLGELFTDRLVRTQSGSEFFKQIDQAAPRCAENGQPRLSAEIFRYARRSRDFYVC